MRRFGALLLMAVAVSATIEWPMFKEKFNKEYSSQQEEQLRKEIYMDNLKYIEDHNRRYALGLTTFNLSINHLADLTEAEYAQFVNPNQMIPLDDEWSEYSEPPVESIDDLPPEEIDWRRKGAVTSVKNVGNCWSGWAFSTVGALEGQHFVQTGSLVELSAQNLIDCSGTHKNYGCMGGVVLRAFNYIIDNKGINTEKSYPYEAIDGDCRFDRKQIGATMSGYVNSPKNNEKQLHWVVAKVGPVSVGLDARHRSFQFYSGGVYYEEKCNRRASVYPMLVVGYGVHDIQGDYWIVKNSWGKEWGLDGYILISRNRDNHCAIAGRAVYPTINSTRLHR